MDGDLSNEVKQLRSALAEVAARLADLEKRIEQQSLTPNIPAEPVKPVDPAVVTPVEVQPLAKKQSLEAKIGLYWLNRLGIGLLVLGIVFLILYSFQYFGAFAKIATGYIVGALMLAGGNWLAEKNNKWVGGNLMGGGWALTYFTTYAMYYFDSVRIIHNPIIDLTLLAAVSAAIVGHSLKRQSENLGLLAIVLGFITVATSTADAFTALSLTFLLGAMSWLVAKTGWSRLYFYGVACAYGIYIFRLADSFQVTLSDNEAFWARSAVLTIYWLVFNALALTLSEDKTSSRKHLVSAVLVNNIAFTNWMMENLESRYGGLRYLFLLISGIVTAGWAYLCRQKNLLTTSRVHMLSALALATAALSIKLHGEWVSLLWAIEVPILVSIGLKQNFRSFRWFAAVLSLAIVFRFVLTDLDNPLMMPIGPWNLPWTQFIGYLIALCLTISGCYYKMPLFFSCQSRLEHKYIHYLYFAAASAIAWGLPLDANSKTLLAIAWAYQGLASLILGCWLSSKFLRILSALFYVWAFCAEISTYDRNRWWVSLLTVSSFFVASYIYRAVRNASRLHGFYTSAAVLLFTVFLANHIDKQFVSLTWAFEGLFFLVVGFKLGDKALRLSALAVFAVLLGKLLLFDMAKAEFIYRVLSFIAAGIIILLGNFAYWRFSNKQNANGGL